MNTRTPAAIRLAQAAAIVHGTCLLLAGLMLLAAAEGPHPLLSSAEAQLAASVAVPLGVALMIAAGYLGRQSQRSLWTLGTLEAVAFATSLLLTLPLLILMAMAMSGIVASTMLSRHPVQYAGIPDQVTPGVRLAQAAGLLHGTCLVIAAGALLEPQEPQRHWYPAETPRWTPMSTSLLGPLSSWLHCISLGGPSTGAACWPSQRWAPSSRLCSYTSRC
jgi:hypothetical protein